MSNTNISDRIRRQLEQPAGVNFDAASALAAQYSSEVNEVNQRLSSAVQLLKRGLRSEAIQVASMHPNVLDWSSALDFPELDDWISILQFLDVEVPPLIDRDSAQQIQEAILEEQPLEELLRQHRRLAIAKAPLSWRLKVLRHIRKEDSLNQVWADDIESWEILRHKQLPAEVNTAVKSQSLEDCEELASELSSKEWSIAPPSELFEKIQSTTNDLKYRSQVEQLSAIVEQLHSAYTEGNQELARHHRSSWNSLSSKLVRPAPRDLVELVEPTLEWLKHCDETDRNIKQHAAACEHLSKEINHSNNLSNIDQAFLNVKHFGLGIDPILEQRYEAKTHQLRLASKRKLQFSFFAAALTAICIVAGLTVWQLSRAFNQAVQTASTELQSMLDKQLLSDAESYIGKIEKDYPRVLQSPAVASLVTRFQAALADEKLRKQEWEKLISQAHDGSSEIVDLMALAAAEKIAKLPEELNKSKEVRRIADRAELKIQQEQFEKVREAATLADQQLLEIERSPLHADLYAIIDQVLDRVSKVRNEYPKCGSRGGTLLDSAEKRARGLRLSIADQISKVAQRDSALRNLKLESDIVSYTRALESYSAAFPSDPLSREFTMALNEKNGWNTPFEWNIWIEQFNKARSSGLAEADALQLATQLTSYDAKVTKNLARNVMPNVKEYLEQMACHNKLYGQLAEDMNKSVLNDLITLVGTVEGTKSRYYVYDSFRASREKSWKKLTDQSVSEVEVLMKGTGAVSSVFFRGQLDVKPHPKTTMQSFAKMLKEMKSNFQHECESNTCKLVREISNSSEIDSQVKQVLLLNVMDALSNSGSKLADDFAPMRSILEDAREGLKNWQDPIEFNNQLNDNLVQELERCARKAQQRAASEKSAVNRLSNLKYEWIGAIEREQSGSARLWTRSPNLQDGYLVMASPQVDNPNVFRIERVGMIENKQPTLQAETNSFVAGKPVYLLPTTIASAQKRSNPPAK